MDTSVGANPFWHSCMLLSKLDESTDEKLEVVENWGFYGLPSTDKSDSLLKKLKVTIGLDVDLQGNHGMLRHEDTRFLDRGTGLHGVTFELTQQQFELLSANCKKMAAEQDAAIREAATALDLTPKSEKETRIYPYEDYSALIFAMEKVKAEQGKRPSRLKPFEFRAALGLGGPTVKHSQTCKSQVVGLLSEVLSEEQIERLTEHGKHPTVPRYSGDVENLYLHSTGPLSAHTKKSGETVYFRGPLSEVTRLFWTLPPQKYETLSSETADLFTVDSEHCGEIRKLVGALQGLEWGLRNSPVPDSPIKEKLSGYKELLLQEVIQTYTAFSTVRPKDKTPKTFGWYGFTLSLFALPRSKEEEELMLKIEDAKMLLNSIYMAMVNGGEFIELDPSIDPSAQVAEDPNDPELFVTYLPTKTKKELCKILGRSYVEPETEESTVVAAI
jgi:hypothetical protein